MTSEEILKGLEDVPHKYKWNNENDSTHLAFLSKQSDPSISQRINETINLPCNSKNDVSDLNKKLVNRYHSIADGVLPRKRTSKQSQCQKIFSYRRTKAKNPWFDTNCIIAKRELKRLAKCYGTSPTNVELRCCYYRHKKMKKETFILNLSSEIEAGNGINWNKFKKPKGYSQKENKLDAFDFLGFCKFFKELYGYKSLAHTRIEELVGDRPDNELTKI